MYRQRSNPFGRNKPIFHAKRASHEFRIADA